jgi:hypothetical protein
MTHVNVFTKAAVEIPEAPTALKYNNNYIQKLGPFLHITNGRRCSMNLLSEYTTVVVDNHVASALYARGSWFLLLEKISVKVPKQGALSVTNENDTTLVTTNTRLEYGARWSAGPMESVGLLRPTFSNLLSVAKSVEYSLLPNVVAAMFPNDVANIIRFIFGLKFGPAYVTPISQCLDVAVNVGASQTTTTHFLRTGGCAKTDNGEIHAIEVQPKYSVGGVAVVPNNTLPDNVTWQGKFKFKLPVQAQSDGLVRRITFMNILMRAQKMKPPLLTKQLTIDEACAPVDPRRLIWGVSVSTLAATISLLTRKSDKEQPNVLGILGFKRKRDLTLVRNLIVIDQKCTSVEAKRILLSMRKGIAYKDALVSKTESLPFRPGTLFRAPKSKVEYKKGRPPWKTDFKILSAASETDYKKYNEPGILLQATSKYWHGLADLREWRGGERPHFQAVWEPKLDGWRILLHWTGNSLIWGSNTGRDISSLIPAKLHDNIKTACGKVSPFILECELVAGTLENCDARFTSKITRENTRGVPKRTRASQVRSKSVEHTLFAVDCIVHNNVDVSNKSYVKRKSLVVQLVDALEAPGLRIVPHFDIVLDSDANVTTTFLKHAYEAMVRSGIEGIVIKGAGLVYGAKHIVLKPVYYITRPSAFPLFDAWDIFRCYAGVVYMGYIEVDRAPWCFPIFGIRDGNSHLRKTHPWHGYTPIHIEGYKIAARMMSHANGYKQEHLIESFRYPTPWFSGGATNTTGCRRFLHKISPASPRLLLVGEMVYERKDQRGWSFPLRFYLARSIAKTVEIDDTTSLFDRLRDMVYPEP